jgi:tetratricopeptide (TPR) repeat protein
MRRTAALSVLAGAAQLAFAQSRVWQDTIALPTWLEGAPDIHPRVDALDPEHSFYPYTARTNFTSTRESQAWRRVNLGNEYLSCSFLPDLGGHLYTCIDKRNGHPLFRGNESIKKADIGPRGAWAATGIEFNFPVTHSRDTVSPVDFGTRQEKDSAEVWLGATDRVTGMRWVAEFILRNGSAVLEQRVSLSNPTAARHPYLWWANADIDLNPGTRFVYPTHVMALEGLTELFSWPRDQKGIDFSRPYTIPESTGLFAYGSREPFMAAYNTSTRTATVHVADPEVVAGKKLYYWGTGNYAWVRQHLSDTNALYVEMQAGLFGNQSTHEFLQPGAEVRFTELWMAGRDLDGVSRANEHAILALERVTAKDELVVQLNVTHRIPGARLALYKGSTAVWDDKTDLSPDRTFERAFSHPENGAAYRFELRDAAGNLLLSHTEGAYEAVAAASVKLGPQPSQEPGGKRDSAANCLAWGQYNEKKSLYLSAENDYREGLKKFGDNVELEKALGRLLVAENRYAEASELLLRAGQKLALDPELHYYLGVALAHAGKEDEARRSWNISAPDGEFGPPSLFEMAALEARSGHAPQAIALMKQAIDRRTSFIAARKLEVALLRHSGAMEAARKECDAALALEPIDSFLRLEAVKLGAKDEALWAHLAADPQRVLELASDYIEIGLYDDALELLGRQYEAPPANQREPGATPPQADSLVSYYRGYIESKLGRDPASDFKLAALQPLEYVFPHYSMAQSALASAAKYDPKDASAIFLTGLLYLDENRIAEAANEFSAAIAIRKDLPAIYYLLGRTLLLLPGKKTEALAALREGVAANPTDKAIKAALQDALHPPLEAAGTTAARAGGRPPMKKPETPIEFATMALSQAAEGQPQLSIFNPRNFPDETQPPAVLQAYVEVQLQAIRVRAARKECASALTGMDSIGMEDRDLPFTMRGLDTYTNGARSQYYLGAVESLCGLSKDARRRWSKVAKMTAAVDSPDFAFPAIAAQSLGLEGEAADWDALLDKVAAAMDEKPEANSALNYSKGILLLAKGDERAAMTAFASGANSPRRDFAWYLNRLALVEASHAGPGK